MKKVKLGLGKLPLFLALLESYASWEPRPALGMAPKRAVLAGDEALKGVPVRLWTLESKVTISTVVEMPPFGHLSSGAHDSPELQGTKGAR